ncbi:hypothetical protein [Burkholderia cepacia]|uniref:hypothetical protein n=1 Tax=Burkholderia cepacia TaxID=292 RepID=UPI000A5490E9|nr:hypothetical protein [Burkholderia cepacia]
MKKKFLLVCEGPTDIQIINKISKSVTNANGNEIEVVPLSPQMDATTGVYPAHGWTAVRTWCKANATKSAASVAHLPEVLRAAALRKNWRAIAAASGSDGVIVQIDTDIAEMIVDAPTTFAASGKSRRAFCNDAILTWLSEAMLDPKMFLILPTYASETWLLACHAPTDAVFSDLPANFSYDDIVDVEDRLISLGYKHKFKNGIKRLDKKQKYYENHVTNLASNLVTVRQRCNEADATCIFFETA